LTTFGWSSHFNASFSRSLFSHCAKTIRLTATLSLFHSPLKTTPKPPLPKTVFLSSVIDSGTLWFKKKQTKQHIFIQNDVSLIGERQLNIKIV
jgi:hypothetical protein